MIFVTIMRVVELDFASRYFFYSTNSSSFSELELLFFGFWASGCFAVSGFGFVLFSTGCASTVFAGACGLTVVVSSFGAGLSGIFSLIDCVIG